jgi:hypothetical protein
VKRYKPYLAALVLAVGLVAPSAAQQVSFVPETGASDPCAEYFGCLHYGDLQEAQARTARGHPQFVEPQSDKVSAAPDRTVQASRIVASSRK